MLKQLENLKEPKKEFNKGKKTELLTLKLLINFLSKDCSLVSVLDQGNLVELMATFLKEKNLNFMLKR